MASGLPASDEISSLRYGIPLSMKRKLASAALILMLFQQVLLTFVPVGEDIILKRGEHALTWNSVFITNLTQWDGQWLLQIAEKGYTDLAHTAFFPLYPLVVRILHIPAFSYAATALAISLICLFIALYVFGLWTCEQFDARTAILAMALMVSFPTAFFFRAAYTESMFLALSVLAVYLSSHQRFIGAGIFVALAALTRNTGILLSIVLLLDYISSRNVGWGFWRAAWWRKLDWQASGLFLPVLGLLLYFFWLKLHTGYFLAFLQAEKVWHRTYAFPWITIKGAIFQLFEPYQLPNLPYHLLEVLSLLVALIGILYGVRYAGKSYHKLGSLLYVAIVLWISTTAPAQAGPHLTQWDYLLSMQRFVLVLFPIFAFLAYRIHSRKFAAVSISINVVVFCAVYGAFCAGYFVG